MSIRPDMMPRLFRAVANSAVRFKQIEGDRAENIGFDAVSGLPIGESVPFRPQARGGRFATLDL